MRVVLFALGLGAFGWGAWLFVDFALPVGPQTGAALGWLLGAPIAHDAILAPVVAVLGWLLTRLAAPAWRTPIQVGAVLTGVLWLLAFPLLWRDFGAPPSPGLHDADTGGGLLLALGVVWAAVLVAGTVRRLTARRGRRRAHGRRTTPGRRTTFACGATLACGATKRARHG